MVPGDLNSGPHACMSNHYKLCNLPSPHRAYKIKRKLTPIFLGPCQRLSATANSALSATSETFTCVPTTACQLPTGNYWITHAGITTALFNWHESLRN